MPRIKHCEYCGIDLGGEVERDHRNDVITCGRRECEQYARDCQAELRAEAHEQLDRDMGYGPEWSA